MAKELFIYIDYTFKESTKIRFSNYFNDIAFDYNVDLNNKSLIAALHEGFSLYKARLMQVAQESIAFKFKKS